MTNKAKLDSSVAKLRSALAAATDTQADDWFPVFKARYGMEVVFRVLREFHAAHDSAQAGEETEEAAPSIITQLFTCCTAVDPICAVGDVPQYADIDTNTLSISPSSVEAFAGDRNRVDAVMLQHTFGMIDEQQSRALADKTHELFPRALVVEDCAHCVARMARDSGGTPVADISVHSFGVEKVLPTRFGGAIWVNPSLHVHSEELFTALTEALSALPALPGHINRTAHAYVNQNRVFARLGGLGVSLRASMQKRGMYEPPIAESEMNGKLAYEPYAPSTWMNERAAAAIDMLGDNYRLRRHNTAMYAHRLGELADKGSIIIPRCAADFDAVQPLLRFPFFVSTMDMSDAVINAVRSAGILAERWYRPELFPGVANVRAYNIPEPGSRAAAAVEMSRRASECIVCLPTDLSDERIDSACSAVESVVK